MESFGSIFNYSKNSIEINSNEPFYDKTNSNNLKVSGGPTITSLQLYLNGKELHPLEVYYCPDIYTTPPSLERKPLSLPIFHPLGVNWLWPKRDESFIIKDTTAPEPIIKGSLNEFRMFQIGDRPFTLGSIVLNPEKKNFHLFIKNGTYKGRLQSMIQSGTLGTVNWTCYFPEGASDRNFNDLKVKVSTQLGESTKIRENTERSVILAGAGENLKIAKDGRFLLEIEMSAPDEVRVNETPILDDVTITILGPTRWISYR
jgi:hypothetical protein